MSPIERETKLVLSPEDYRRILEGGRVLECTDQLNIYLHDPDRLDEEVGYFRVRLESGRAPVATLKVPIGWKGEMREMVEVERPLSELGPALFPRPRRWVMVDTGVPEGFTEHFRALGIKRLRRLGWMRNHRTVIELGELGRVELDRTVLPDGRVHHEVEIENPSEKAHQALVERVRTLAPAARFTRVGKFARFLAAVGLG
ncbi:MAG: CYTH domain-containing protein [Gemmatimonadota bacterium]